MGFPENVLTSGEKVVKDLHPHPMTVGAPALLGVVLLGIAVAVAVVTPDDSTGNTLQWVVVGLAVLAAIPLVIVPLMAWRTTHYVVTTHRVMLRKGIFSKSGKDITLSKITDVSFHQSVFDRMIRSGTLNIESAGDSPNEQFRNIPRSNEVQQLINRLVDEDANRRSAVIYEHMAGASHPPYAEPDSRTDPLPAPQPHGTAVEQTQIVPTSPPPPPPTPPPAG